MKLADYMKETGKKPVDIAEEIGVAENSVRRWVAGSRTPDPAMMRAVYAATKGAVRPDDFVLEGR
jgi:DNA-binding transcriptional regulator YdaS (Cro superfamily)